ncbi:MAG TPA: 5-oxoprolinase subunit PxpB [Saprospiraceae bacterium]|nr:5-oxoprolinase subunit PxpB [Saprospiraceae bacterium]HMQ84974.1 5-oxoprolinase subunit PxpB [Saprospiraceae bacterium]
MDAQLPILPYGDSALIIRFGTGIAMETNQKVHQLRTAILQKALPGVKCLIPAYDTLTLLFDPLQVGFEDLERRIQTIWQANTSRLSLTESRCLYIPVWYHGPDWEVVERQTSLSKEAAIHWHSQTVFQVFMLGFLPGFPYLGKLPAALHCQRKATPRGRIPARSVGIAGEQTGIYPFASPGGWQLIGQTPVPLFDPKKERPFLFSPGDQVQFYTIGEALFRHLETHFQNNHFNPFERYE